MEDVAGRLRTVFRNGIDVKAHGSQWNKHDKICVKATPGLVPGASHCALIKVLVDVPPQLSESLCMCERPRVYRAQNHFGVRPQSDETFIAK